MYILHEYTNLIHLKNHLSNVYNKIKITFQNISVYLSKVLLILKCIVPNQVTISPMIPLTITKKETSTASILSFTKIKKLMDSKSSNHVKNKSATAKRKCFQAKQSGSMYDKIHERFAKTEKLEKRKTREIASNKKIPEFRLAIDECDLDDEMSTSIMTP